MAHMQQWWGKLCTLYNIVAHNKKKLSGSTSKPLLGNFVIKAVSNESEWLKNVRKEKNKANILSITFAGIFPSKVICSLLRKKNG